MQRVTEIVLGLAAINNRTGRRYANTYHDKTMQPIAMDEAARIFRGFPFGSFCGPATVTSPRCPA